MKARIIEIFLSIQGEGLWMGKPQVFVRFHGCKLNCSYCDTPRTHHLIHEARIEYPPYSKKFERHDLLFSIDELSQTISRFGVNSLAITGGEPLEQVDFIGPWLESLEGSFEVLLETSGVEVDALKRVIPMIDMVSLDLKIPSATRERSCFKEHDQFLTVARPRSHYAKIVYDEKMTDEEKNHVGDILKKYPELIAIFQPVSPLQKRDIKQCLALFHFFAEKYPNQVRLIPQVHKFLGVL